MTYLYITFGKRDAMEAIEKFVTLELSSVAEPAATKFPSRGGVVISGTLRTHTLTLLILEVQKRSTQEFVSNAVVISIDKCIQYAILITEDDSFP